MLDTTMAGDLPEDEKGVSFAARCLDYAALRST